MEKSVHVRTLQRAAAILGGVGKLRDVLRVSMSELDAWIHGRARAPVDVFLKAVDIVSTPGPGMLEAALDEAIVATGAAKGNLQLARPEGLRIAAQRGFDKPFLEFFSVVSDDASACGAAMKQTRRIVITDTATHPLFAGTPAGAVLSAAGVCAVQSTPIVGDQGALLGVLSTHYAMPRDVTAYECARLDLISRRAASWLEGRSA